MEQDCGKHLFAIECVGCVYNIVQLSNTLARGLTGQFLFSVEVRVRTNLGVDYNIVQTQNVLARIRTSQFLFSLKVRGDTILAYSVN
jgi:hypothetical protein